MMSFSEKQNTSIKTPKAIKISIIPKIYTYIYIYKQNIRQKLLVGRKICAFSRILLLISAANRQLVSACKFPDNFKTQYQTKSI